jgi:1,4-alpha-glucan branching enzyme
MTSDAYAPLSLPHESTKDQKRIRVRFYHHDALADEVSVAGSFNRWDPSATPMLNIGQGRWTAYLFLPPGRYQYQYIVDGCWTHDRRASELVDNAIGTINSVLEVPGFPAATTRSTSHGRRANFSSEVN